MKIALLIVLGLAGVLAVAVLALYLAGSRLPREHRAQVTVVLSASRVTVWAALTDYAAMPQWWPAVKSVRLEKRPDGTELTWNTDRHGQEIPFRTVDSRTNEKLVRLIARDDLPFGGTWTYELADAGPGATRLTLTEDGFINPPIFRAVARWFLGLDTTMKDFLLHFEKRAVALEHGKPVP
jgi:uncharacterized protein YndB with AHSA1/START domain